MVVENMPDTSEALGRRIRKLREASGKTQHELAAKAGVSQKHMGELERGRGNPSLKNIQGIASALGLSLTELFDFEPEEKSDALVLEELLLRLQSARPETIRFLHRVLRP